MSRIMQHELKEVCVVDLTNFDATADLGAPFKVILANGVKRYVGHDGRSKIMIEDLTGLFKTVVQLRVSDPRKLNGHELRFIRRVVGLTAKSLAKNMDITPEHLSRCEAGTKVLSGAPEKIFRMTTFVGSFCPDPELLLADIEDEKKKKKDKKPMSAEATERMNRLLISFARMDIQNAFSADDPFVLELCLCCDDDDDDMATDDDESPWKTKPCEAAAA